MSVGGVGLTTVDPTERETKRADFSGEKHDMLNFIPEMHP